MAHFIVTSEQKDALDYLGKKIGVTEKRVLCYSKSLGKRRIYRDSLKNCTQKLHILEYKTEQKAQDACDQVNEAYNDDFKVEKIEDDETV